GYDTGLQRNEARLFSAFYSPELKALRETNVFLRFGIQSCIVWPDARGILDKTGAIGAASEARLRVLGTGDILWSQRIPNLEPAAWTSDVRAWQHELADSSPVNVLRDARPEDVATLFNGTPSEDGAKSILDRLKPAPL